MSAQEGTSRRSPSESSPKRQPHRRSNSAAANLVSVPRTQASTVCSPIPEDTLPRSANGNAVSVPLRYQHPSQLSSPSASRYPKSPSSAPSRQNRGKTWESWMQDTSVKLPETAKEPYNHGTPGRKTPFTAKFHEIESRKEIRQHKPPPLGLSAIQRTFMYSPQRPIRSVATSSPVNLSPQSSVVTNLSETSSKVPSPTDYSKPPKHMSAFEYAMRPFLDENLDHEPMLQLPTPTGQDVIPDSDPPLLLPLRDDEISYAGGDKSETEDEAIPADGIPAHLREKDAFRTRMRLIQLRTLLMRCQAAQSTAHLLERKPWAQEAKRPPYYYYSKMRHFAYRARRLAEALESRDLQARCEYWAGRACGGTRDWHAAKQHFALAIKLDVQHDTFSNGRVRTRGLRPDEKEDVQFLLESVTKRHESWVKKTADARMAAQYESEAWGKPIEECMDWDSFDSPAWFPDRDRVVQIAKREFSTRSRLGRSSRCAEASEWRSITMAKTPKSGRKHNDENNSRRELSCTEWQYIRHGDEQTKKRKANVKRAFWAKNQNKTARYPSKYSTASAFSSDPSNMSISPAPPRNLLEELEAAGWTNRTPTPPGSCETPSPPMSLRQRRNLDIAPISTNGIRRRESLGRAVHGSSPADLGILIESPE